MCKATKYFYMSSMYKQYFLLSSIFLINFLDYSISLQYLFISVRQSITKLKIAITEKLINKRFLAHTTTINYLYFYLSIPIIKQRYVSSFFSKRYIVFLKHKILAIQKQIIRKGLKRESQPSKDYFLETRKFLALNLVRIFFGNQHRYREKVYLYLSGLKIRFSKFLRE